MPGPYVGNPLSGYFGIFQAAVGDPAVRAQPGGIQQYVWQGLTNEFASRGESLPQGAFQHVNQLLSLAGQQRRAAQALAESFTVREQSGFEQALSANHLAPAIDTRALNEQVLGPQARVIYRASLLVEGEPVLQYYTHDFGYDLPQSLGNLQAQVEMAAQLVAADYEYEWGGEATPVSLQTY